MVLCQNCGQEIGDAKFCSNCGSEIHDDKNQKSTKFCSNCGESIDINAVACPQCGVEQKANKVNTKQTKFCSNCGSEIDFNAIICPECGVQIQNTSLTQEINPTVAIILSIFIPGLGHIYSGLTHKGIIILVLYIISAILMMAIIGFILVIIIWIWAIIDVNNCVKALNNGEHVEDKSF